MEGDDKEEIRRLSEELTMLPQAGRGHVQQASQAEGQKAGRGPQAAPKPLNPKEDVVDADFEEVKDDKK